LGTTEEFGQRHFTEQADLLGLDLAPDARQGADGGDRGGGPSAAGAAGGFGAAPGVVAEPGGREVRKDVTYVISTAPNLTVSRKIF
jgi:hypothetical protein